eukprot:Gb_21450 [translate_table: standard]
MQTLLAKSIESAMPSFENSAKIREEKWAVTLHRKSTVIPSSPTQPGHEQCKLSPSDLQMLCCNYIQKGLLYRMPTDNFQSVVELLKSSLSQVLVYFYPLAGRLSASPDGIWHVDCDDVGVDIIEASAEHVGLADVLVPDVPSVVRQLFAMDGAINLEGRFLPLLVVQVTKLRDGIAIGCTLNHALADGTSIWHFFNSWAQFCRDSKPIFLNAPIPIPIHNRLFTTSGSTTLVRLDLPRHEPARPFSPPLLREKIFHFSTEMISMLKDRANRGSKGCQPPISSFQALSAHVWLAITRARRLGPHEPTTFKLAVNCRGRLVPPLPSSYFGNAIQFVSTTVKAGELLGNDIDFAAGLLHQIIDEHRDANIREALNRWVMAPVVFQPGKCDPNCVMMGSSPRFPMYDNDFGWGKPVAVRSGWANKFDGKLSAYPGIEGGGSVDLEICLLPRFMNALEIDQQFLLFGSE